MKQWDQFPFILVQEMKKGNILGANVHYMNVKSRLTAINKNRFPTSTLHYYIPKRADAIFFEVEELDVPTMSQMPVEQFHRNKYLWQEQKPAEEGRIPSVCKESEKQLRKLLKLKRK